MKSFSTFISEGLNTKKEIFSSVFGNFDIDRFYRLKEARKIKFKLVDAQIGEIATKTLALQRGVPLDQQKHSVMGGLYFPNLEKVDPVIDEPGILISLKHTDLVIDGNHRLARRYLTGRDTMQFYHISDPKEVDKLRI